MTPAHDTTVAIGLAGSITVALAGTAIGRSLPADWVHHLPITRTLLTTRPAAYALAFVGLTALSWAWVAGVRMAGQIGPREAGGTALMWAAPFVLVPPLFSDDAWSYAAQSTLTRLGLSPYAFHPIVLGPGAAGVNARWLDSASPYGPLALTWGSVTERLWPGPWPGVLAYRLLAVLAVALIAFVAARLARSSGRDPSRAVWLAAANPVTLVHGVAGGHLDLVTGAMMLTALLLAQRRRWVLGAVVLGCAAAVKWPALVVLPGLVLLSRPGPLPLNRLRRLSVTALVSVGTLALTCLLPATGWGWARAATLAANAHSGLSLPDRIAALLVLLLGQGHAASVRTVVLGLATLTLLLVASAVVLRGRERTPDALRTSAALAGAELLLAPVMHYWYFLLALPVLACAPLGRRAGAALVALVVGVAMVAPFDPSRHLPATGWFPPLLVGALAALFLRAWMRSPAHEHAPPSAVAVDG